MTKDFAASKAGTQAALAELLGVTSSAVRNWGQTMPPRRVLQLQELRPKWFAAFKRLKGTP